MLVVGAGLSGVGAGHYLKSFCPWARVAILEARESIGGTWDLFRFPGIRSDSDMYTLGYAFRPWNSEQTIADGTSIRHYIEDTAQDSGIEGWIRFRHRVISAAWSSARARWTVAVRKEDTGQTVHFTAAFLFTCTGYYRYDQGYLPDFPGAERFRGPVVHPQFWPEDLDYSGKQVVVIGSGATAVTMVPVLAETAGHVSMVQRSPSYVASVPRSNPLAHLIRRLLPGPTGSRIIRWLMAGVTLAFFQVCRRWPERTKGFLIQGASRHLPEGYDVTRHFTPRYDPWDQRLCAVPDGDLFAAISDGRVSVVTDHIRTFTEDGLQLESGRELPADVIITATGLELQFAGGIEFSIDGRPVDPSERLVYKGAMLEGMPNFAFSFGYVNASWTLKCDLTCQYVVRLLNELRTVGMRQSTPVDADGSVEASPFLGLTSGYVQRAVHRMPRQGTRFPWQVHQNYFRDYRIMKLRGIEDEGMVFSNPGPFPGPRSGDGSDEPPKLSVAAGHADGAGAAVSRRPRPSGAVLVGGDRG